MAASVVVVGLAEQLQEEEMEEENVLYDLLVNVEWPPEAEPQPRGYRRHGASSFITKAITGPASFILQYIWYSPAKFSLPIGLVRRISKQVNWHLVLASNGKLLAIVQDQCVEIRSAKDDFGSVIGKCQALSLMARVGSGTGEGRMWSLYTTVENKEEVGNYRPYPKTLIPIGEGWPGAMTVHFLPTQKVPELCVCFDLMGSELFVIPPANSFPGDFGYAVAGLIFLEYKASTQWSAELLVINYCGQLKSYLISVGTNQSYQENHSFNFDSHYCHGITTAVYHPGHSLQVKLKILHGGKVISPLT